MEIEELIKQTRRFVDEHPEVKEPGSIVTKGLMGEGYSLEDTAQVLKDGAGISYEDIAGVLYTEVKSIYDLASIFNAIGAKYGENAKILIELEEDYEAVAHALLSTGASHVEIAAALADNGVDEIELAKVLHKGMGCSGTELAATLVLAIGCGDPKEIADYLIEGTDLKYSDVVKALSNNFPSLGNLQITTILHEKGVNSEKIAEALHHGINATYGDIVKVLSAKDYSCSQIAYTLTLLEDFFTEDEAFRTGLKIGRALREGTPASLEEISQALVFANFPCIQKITTQLKQDQIKQEVDLYLGYIS